MKESNPASINSISIPIKWYCWLFLSLLINHLHPSQPHYVIILQNIYTDFVLFAKVCWMPKGGLDEGSTDQHGLFSTWLKSSCWAFSQSRFQDHNTIIAKLRSLFTLKMHIGTYTPVGLKCQYAWYVCNFWYPLSNITNAKRLTWHHIFS